MPEEIETLDYTKEAIKAHIPVKRVVDGQLYIDGVRVDRWQLTEEEIKEFFSEEYYRKSQCASHVPCPIPECHGHVDSQTKIAWSAHIRHKHREWYNKHKQKMWDSKVLEDVWAMVKDDTEANDK